MYNDKQEQDSSSNQYYHPHRVECTCQEAAYNLLGTCPKNDQAVAAAFSLNAPVVRDSQVGEQSVFKEANSYGLHII
jgi:hypothetical protein